MRREVVHNPLYLKSGDVLLAPQTDIGPWRGFEFMERRGCGFGAAIGFVNFQSTYCALGGPDWPMSHFTFITKARTKLEAEALGRGLGKPKMRRRWIVLRPVIEKIKLKPNEHFRKALPLP